MSIIPAIALVLLFLVFIYAIMLIIDDHSTYPTSPLVCGCGQQTITYDEEVWEHGYQIIRHWRACPLYRGARFPESEKHMAKWKREFVK